MFGTEPKVGLTSSSIPAEIIQHLETEDDLRTALSVPYSRTLLTTAARPRVGLGGFEPTHFLPGPILRFVQNR